MLPFWPSDVVLIAVQAALVLGPRPPLPRPLHRLRSGAWAWVLPLSLGGTIALVAQFPGLAPSFTYLSLVALPVLAVPALAVRAGARVAVGLAVLLFVLAWAEQGSLVGQGAAVAITALSAATLASYLCAVAPRTLLKVAIVVMSVLDAYLVFGQLLEAPNNAINAASPGSGLPQLQVAGFGSAFLGYGDLFVAATFGGVLLSRLVRRRAALTVLAFSCVFDLLFLVVGTLPATVPVALTLIVFEVVARRRGRPSLSDLFVPEPEQWGFRGDPHVWAAMRARLTGQPVPPDPAEASAVLRQTFHDLVGLYPEERGDIVDGTAVHREEFDTGGMSGGGVALTVWRDRLLPLLVSRAEKASAGRAWTGDADDTDRLRERPVSG